MTDRRSPRSDRERSEPQGLRPADRPEERRADPEFAGAPGIALPAGWTPEGGLVMRVSGDRFAAAGIRDGDYLVCASADALRSDTFGVCQLEGEASRRLGLRRADGWVVARSAAEGPGPAHIPERVHVVAEVVSVHRFDVVAPRGGVASEG